ncbi:uncharacterized protein [Prorops nasuta]|uniref:uncharacterized protein n=1 Tax=Prorops nasuta TaxID=863751 RepID=UPI0034CFE1B5
MAERIKLILQKRSALKSQITVFGNILDKSNIDISAMKLRLKRLTELFNNFEELFDELMVMEPNPEHQTEFESIQDRFYSVAGKAENIISSAVSTSLIVNSANSDTRADGSLNMSNIEKRVKLPQISLPTFNGQYEDWMSFKNAFRSLINSREDLSEIDKLHYLKSALIGEAAKKIAIFSISSANYTKAWEILERSYEVKRILVSKHISSILNAPYLEKESSQGLSKLADDMQQNVASLEALGIHVTPEIAVHVLESKLPKTILMQWESSLSRDEFPSLEKMYEFLYRCAVSTSRRERTRKVDDNNKGEVCNKKRKIGTGQAFASNTIQSCIVCCNHSYPIYKCETFRKHTPQERLGIIKKARLCYNCLRSHVGKPCKLSGCTICNQRHNTLLYLSKEASANETKETLSKTKTEL